MATTSFIKASVLPLFQSGRLFAEADTQEAAQAFGVPAFNVFPVIANASRDVEDLADEIFGRRRLPLLSLRLKAKRNFGGGKMVGFLDEALMRTMRRLNANEPISAAILHDQFPADGITQTAWSNRLNDLWRGRLLRRTRQGKSWLYQPLTNEVTYGR